MNKLLKTLVFNDEISLSILETTDMVNDAIKIHNLSPVCAAALGRTMTVVTHMASCLKGENEKLSVTVKGDGKCGKITVCGNGELKMRGSIENPNVELPLKDNGKLDVGGCVGKNGRLTVVKSMGLKEPFSGNSQLVSGEIAEDFTAYYAYSEQIPTAIALGVKLGKDLTCIGAGGVIMQALPNASEESLIRAEKIIAELKDVSSKIEEMGAEKVLEKYFGKVKYTEYNPEYKCLCSRERVKDVLISLGKKEIDEIIAEQKSIKIKCEFCEKEYEFKKDETDKFF